MKKGYLSEYFKGIACKRISTVEIDPEISHQHEFNGARQLKDFFGENRCRFSAKMIYLREGDNDPYSEDSEVTWYDARENHPIRSEYRLYYTGDLIKNNASEGDLLIICKKPDDSLLIIIVQGDSTIENNLIWLFSLPEEDLGSTFAVKEITGKNDQQIGFVSRLILAEIGIEVSPTDDYYLEMMLREFGEKFPTTNEFSNFARKTTKDIDSINDPDYAILQWINQEEILFYTLERYLVESRIKNGFQDVDTFISYSLSVHNRRKSRAGYSLENHFEHILKDNCISYSRGKITENDSRPDFIFPSIQEYHDKDFYSGDLKMLGAKSTCKDRWRQVLSEAERIKEKHLLTLEPGISEKQTNQMKANQLTLVIPRDIHITYKSSQLKYILEVKDFLNLVRNN